MLNEIRRYQLRSFFLSDKQEAFTQVFHLSPNQLNQFKKICELAEIINDNEYSSVEVHNDIIHELVWNTDYTTDYDLDDAIRYIAYGNLDNDYVWLAYVDATPDNHRFVLLGLLFLGETDGNVKFLHFVELSDYHIEHLTNFFGDEFNVANSALWLNVSR